MLHQYQLKPVMIIFFALTSVGFCQKDWIERSSGITKNLNSIVWTGEKLVTVGDSGNILTSEDGITWLKEDILYGYDLICAAWNESKLVAVGNTGTILTSEDGKEWIKQTSGIESSLLFVTWTNQRLIALEDGYSILTSIDGISWEKYDGMGMRALVWFDSQYVAVGDGGYIWTSSNFNMWTVRFNITDRIFNNVIATGNIVVAVGGQMGNAAIYNSREGINWNPCTISASNKILNAIIWDGALFVTVGNRGTVLTSSDGVNWISQGSNVTKDINSIAFTGTQYVAVGDSGTIITSPVGNNSVIRKIVRKQDINGISLKRNGNVLTVHLACSLRGSTVSVFSLAGKRVPLFSRKDASSSFEIDTHNFAPGVYQILVENQGIKTARWFTINR